MKPTNYKVSFTNPRDPVLKINCKRVKSRNPLDTLKSGLHGGTVYATGHLEIQKALKELFS